MTTTSIESDDFLQKIKSIEDFPAYVDIKESQFMVIGLHQHFGLIQNFILMCHNLIEDRASLVVPDLYSGVPDEILNQKTDVEIFKTLKFEQVAHCLSACVSFGLNKGKKIIVMGFSLGAALGLKLLETAQNVYLAFFFYGLPNLNGFDPSQIRCPTVVFQGKKDKVKFLSDKETFEKTKEKCKGQSNIKFEILFSSHGYMNHESINFDQKSFQHCQKVFFDHLDKEAQQTKRNKKKEESSDCQVF